MPSGIRQRQPINGADGPPSNVTVVVEEQEDSSISGLSRNDVWKIVTREARAVSAWAVLAPLFRLAFAPLLAQASVSEDAACRSSPLSVIAGWILYFFPRTVAQNKAPGFMFASAWLLFHIRDSFGVIPNVPIRICEMTMGRLRLRDLCIVLPVHFLCALSTFSILKLLLSSSMSQIALAPISYSQNNPLLLDFMYEMAVNCAFTIMFLVVPEIFALNKVPRFFVTLLMYPLYSFGVDSNGMASTFGPNVLYALASVGSRSEEEPSMLLGQTTFRLVGVVVGSLMGGFIMRTYFPDDSKR